MKKKLVALALILALAVSALSLAACGTDFSKTYNNPSEDKVAKQAMGWCDVLNAQKNLNMDFSAQDVDGIFGLFLTYDPTTNLPIQKVYNFESDTVVGTFADTETATGTKTVTVTYEIEFNDMFVNDDFHDYFVVKKRTVAVDSADHANDDDVSEYTLYNADGTSFATCKEHPDVRIDTIFAGNDYYRLNKEGKFEKAGSRAKNAIDLPVFDTMIDGKYYYTEDNQLFVYDSSFVLINYYQFPSFATSANFFFLNDGNVLLQYMCKVSPYDADYNYYDGTNNYKVITQIYKIKDGSLKDVETVCLFDYLTAHDSEPNGAELRFVYGSGIENLASVRYITNTRRDNNRKLVSIKNDGSIDKVLSENFVAQSETTPIPLASGKFVVLTKDASVYLVSAKGDIIADITGCFDFYNYELVNINQKYIVLDGKIYDHDFNELATFDEDKWEVLMMNNSVVLRSLEDAKKFKLFADGKFTEITLSDGQTLVDGTERYFVIRTVVDAVTTYSYYNENGVKLLDSAVFFDNIKSTRTGKVLCNGSTYDDVSHNFVYTNIVLYTAVETK